MGLFGKRTLIKLAIYERLKVIFRAYPVGISTIDRFNMELEGLALKCDDAHLATLILRCIIGNGAREQAANAWFKMFKDPNVTINVMAKEFDDDTYKALTAGVPGDVLKLLKERMKYADEHAEGW